ncbi:MAG: arylsulfatase [Rubripirellula sp.]
MRLASSLLGLLVCVCLSAADFPKRPNIVYILADDLGFGDVSCYNPSSKIKTPHIDRLAEDGMRFTDAHTPSSVCTPTRYGILTGRYCWRTRLKYRVLDGFDPPLIEQDQVTVPSLLRQHGYQTGCVGKWHLGMQWTDRVGAAVPAVSIDRRTPPRSGRDVDYTQPIEGGPNAVGFDFFFGISASLNMSPFCYLKNNRPVQIPNIESPRIRNEFIVVDEGIRSSDFAIAGVTPRLNGEAVAFIERSAAAAKEQGGARRPFFLYFPLTAPHLPVIPNAEFQGVSQAGLYGDFVVEVDATVGAIVNAIERAGVAENTLVIFSSDNGGLYHWWSPQEADDVAHYKPTPRGQSMKEYGHQGNAHLRGTKADIWEGGHRVPLIAKWPAAIGASRISHSLIELTDLLATCAEILGVDLPSDAGPDSHSMLGAMLGTIGSERDFAVHHSLWGTFAIREGDWKMVPQRGSGGFTRPRQVEPAEGESVGQLYNLAEDPSETKNVWNENPEVVRRLADRLKRIRE